MYEFFFWYTAVLCLRTKHACYLVYSEGEPYSLQHQFLLFGASLDRLELRGNPFQVLPRQLHRLEFDLHAYHSTRSIWNHVATIISPEYAHVVQKQQQLRNETLGHISPSTILHVQSNAKAAC